VPLPVKIHSMLLLEIRDSRSRTSAPISLLPWLDLDNCAWPTLGSNRHRRNRLLVPLAPHYPINALVEFIRQPGEHFQRRSVLSSFDFRQLPLRRSKSRSISGYLLVCPVSSQSTDLPNSRLIALTKTRPCVLPASGQHSSAIGPDRAPPGASGPSR